MTPKEKAKELVKKYSEEFKEYGVGNVWRRISAKKHALIAVDEILDFMILTMKWSENHNGNVHYWQEVKQEIEKL